MPNLKWTKKQREVAVLVGQGKAHGKVVKAGHSEGTVCRVINALKRGDAPPAPRTTANTLET